jgi:hypothetical protein
MKKVDDRINEKVRRICQDINNRANDRQNLQTLAIELQEVLREDRYDTRAVKATSQSDNPFDKIMVG